MCGHGPETPAQTPEEKALGDLAIQRWNDYQTRFVPVENELIRHVQQTAGNYDQLRGQSGASVQQAFAPKVNNLEHNLFAHGITPDSGQFTHAVDQMGLDLGLSKGTGVNEANLSVDNNYLKNLQGIVQMGQGQAGDTIRGFGSEAGTATRDAINRADRSFQNRMAGLDLAGTVGGAGTAAYLHNSGLPEPGTDTGPATIDRLNYNMLTHKGGY